MTKPFIHSQLSELIEGDFEYGFQCLSTIFDALDVLVYVSDMETHELLFFNRYGMEEWGIPEQSKCFEVLQSNQERPCSFCTNPKLVDKQGNPTGIHVWEFQNTINHRWYQCHDQAIKWLDGRLVRLEIAIDISDQKELEQQLRAAHAVAKTHANQDPLLNCLNRRAFFERFDSLLAQCVRQSYPLTLVMIDIDDFKAFNDNYGHNFGDQVLLKTTTAFKKTIRDADLFARYGGDEFILALPNTTDDNAIELINRIKEEVDTIQFENGPKITINLSYGLTSLKEKSTADTLLNQADIALYQAKHSGRNQIRIYHSPFE